MYVGGAGYVGGGGGGGGGTSDHGELDGLADDDHTQYSLADGSRGTANLASTTGTLPVASGGTGATDAAGALTNLGALSTTGTAADSSLLGGQNSAYYRNAGNINAGTLTIARGGTGGTSVTTARAQLLMYPINGLVGMRLTPSSTDPLGESSGSDVLYCLPYIHQYVVTINESGAIEHFAAATYGSPSFDATTDTDYDGAAITSSSVYDVFWLEDSNDATLVLKKWTNATTRATALTRATGSTGGALVLTGATDHLYLGTVRTSSTTQFVSEPGRRYIWNFQNRVRYADISELLTSPANYALGSAVAAQTLNNANYDAFNHRYVVGLTGGTVVRADVAAFVGVTSGDYDLWVGLDGSTQAGPKARCSSTDALNAFGTGAGLGYHTLAAYESTTSGSSIVVNVWATGLGTFAGFVAEGEW